MIGHEPFKSSGAGVVPCGDPGVRGTRIWGPKGRKKRRTPNRAELPVCKRRYSMVVCGASFWSAGAEVVAFWSDGAELVSVLVCGAGFVPSVGTVGHGNRAFDANWMKHVEQQIGQ